ncbi:MAG: AsmA family protein [Pseudomonadales bacterium]|jgi:AsmA protein|nr:AsmA family protein [Pseudomonadales bacterium]
MKKLLVFLGSLIGLVLVLAIGALAYVLTFDLNANKALIASKFQEATGRTLTLDGQIEWSLYPWLGLTLNQVSIGNAEGFSATPLLRANHLQARVKLLPLFNKAIEIDTIRLDGVALNLEVHADGGNNWNFSAAPATSSTPSADNGGGIGITNFILGGVDIRDTSLIYDDQAANTHYEINGLNLQIGELIYGEPLDIRMSLDASSRVPQLGAALTLNGTVLYDLDNERYDLNPLALSANLSGPAVPGGAAALTLDGAFSADLAADTLSLPRLQLSALGNQLSATAQVSKLSSGAPALQATLNASGDDLAVLLRLAGQNELAQQVASLGNRFDIQSTLNADLGAGTLALPQLSATLLGASIAGKLDAQRINTATPAFSGELNAQGPDLPLLLQVAGQLQGAQSALNGYGQQLRGLRDRSFRIQSSFSGDLQRGNLSLPALDAALLGFTLQGQLDAQDMNRGGNVNGSFNLRGDDLREFLTALGQTDLAQAAQALTLQAEVKGSGGSFAISPLDLSLVVTGPQVGNQPQTLSLKADTNVNLDAERLNVDAFTLSGLGLALNGKVQVNAFSGSQLNYQGQVQVPAFDARRLMNQLNLPLETADNTVLQQVALNANFTGGANNFALDDFSLKLDDSQLTGMLNLNDLSALAGNFRLDIDAIDVDRYLAPPVEASDASSSGGDDALPVDTLKTLNVQGDINAGQLAISGLKMQDISLRIAAANGKLALNPIAATLYQGRFNGDIQLDVAGQEPRAQVNTTLTNIELLPLLQDFMDSDYLSGKGSVQLALTSGGGSINDLKRGLNGSGSINLTDGVLSGIDVGNTLARVETMIRNKQLMQLNQQGGQTPFQTFAATLNVASGVISTRDLVISAPDWGITGNGTLANLNDDSINFNLVALMQEGTLNADGSEYQVGGHALPIACTGNLSGPRCLPDVQAIFTAAVGNAVQERVTDLLRDRLGGGQQQPQQNQAAPATGQETQEQPQQQAPSTEDRVRDALRGLLR